MRAHLPSWLSVFNRLTQSSIASSFAFCAPSILSAFAFRICGYPLVAHPPASSRRRVRRTHRMAARPKMQHAGNTEPCAANTRNNSCTPRSLQHESPSHTHTTKHTHADHGGAVTCVGDDVSTVCLPGSFVYRRANKPVRCWRCTPVGGNVRSVRPRARARGPIVCQVSWLPELLAAYECDLRTTSTPIPRQRITPTRHKEPPSLRRLDSARRRRRSARRRSRRRRRCRGTTANNRCCCRDRTTGPCRSATTSIGHRLAHQSRRPLATGNKPLPFRRR